MTSESTAKHPNPWRKRGMTVLWALVDGLDRVADFAETSAYQVFRILATLGVVWVLRRSFNQVEAVHNEAFIGIENQSVYLKSAVVCVFCALGIAVLWSGPLCSLLAGSLWQILDTADRRRLDEDPMEKVAKLVRAGKKQRAISLCRRMLRRNQGSPLALEAMIARLSD